MYEFGQALHFFEFEPEQPEQFVEGSRISSRRDDALRTPGV
jgi:hypothetical protein